MPTAVAELSSLPLVVVVFVLSLLLAGAVTCFFVRNLPQFIAINVCCAQQCGNCALTSPYNVLACAGASFVPALSRKLPKRLQQRT